MVQYSAVLVWYGTRYQVPAAAGTLQYQYRTVLYCSITIDYYLLEPVSPNHDCDVRMSFSTNRQ